MLNKLNKLIYFKKMDSCRGRLAESDLVFVDDFEQSNPGFEVGDSESFNYYDVITHIPVQRSNHQQASHAYRTNQMVKHVFEDGHMNLPQLNQHTNLMDNMSDKEAFLYAKQNLNFN